MDGIYSAEQVTRANRGQIECFVCARLVVCVCLCVHLCVCVELIKSSQQTSVTSLFFVQFLANDES